MLDLATDRSISDPATVAPILTGDAPGMAERGGGDQRNLREVTFEDLLRLVAAAGPGASRASTVELYSNWILCQGRTSPYLSVAWLNLGVELENGGDRAGAMFAYRNALVIWPRFPAAVWHLTRLLEADGQTKEALATLDAALQPVEERISLTNQRARLLEECKRLQEAKQELEKSLLIQPEQPDVIQHWVHVCQKQCHWGILSDVVLGMSPENRIRYAGPLSALALIDDVAQQRMINEIWIERKVAPVVERLSPRDGYHHDRIRLGYMSSDFCRHAMSLLIAELFERHDRDRFEVFGYCSSPEDGSDVRARVMAAFDHFTRIASLSDEQAARRIRADEIDILIDLNGLTSGTRFQVLRWRPAPVQATYLGFIGPVPLPELDYMFCDRIVVPPAIAPEYRPTPLYVAEFYQANDSKRALPAPRSRAELGLPEDSYVFCCFSNHYKITEAMFAAWMEILHRVDNGILWLIDDNTCSCANLARAGQKAGIAADRIRFAPRTGPTEYLAYFSVADLFLDTYPYNAGTIASDAIRMHLPLLTLSGQSFASRMAGRLLAALGAGYGIAETKQGYVEKAVALATDGACRATYKALFTDNAWAATIGNIGRFTEEYERSLGSIVVRPPAGQATVAPGARPAHPEVV